MADPGIATRIPTDVLIHIFGYLRPIPDLFTVARVCKEWRTLAHSAILWHDVDVAHGSLANSTRAKTIKAGLLSMVRMHQAHIRRLNLARNRCLTDAVFLSILTKCQVLESLDVSGCHDVTGRSIASEWFPLASGNVMELLLASSTLGPRAVTEGLVSRMNNLTVLSVARSPHFNKNDMSRLVEVLHERCPNLRVVDVSYCRSVSAFHVKSLATGCRQLTEMYLVGLNIMSYVLHNIVTAVRRGEGFKTDATASGNTQLSSGLLRLLIFKDGLWQEASDGRALEREYSLPFRPAYEDGWALQHAIEAPALASKPQASREAMASTILGWDLMTSEEQESIINAQAVAEWFGANGEVARPMVEESDVLEGGRRCGLVNVVLKPTPAQPSTQSYANVNVLGDENAENHVEFQVAGSGGDERVTRGLMVERLGGEQLSSLVDPHDIVIPHDNFVVEYAFPFSKKLRYQYTVPGGCTRQELAEVVGLTFQHVYDESEAGTLGVRVEGGDVEALLVRGVFQGDDGVYCINAEFIDSF